MANSANPNQIATKFDTGLYYLRSQVCPSM